MISVIIPLLNGADTLGDQLAALSEQDYDGSWELVIADNGSTDGGLSLLTSWSSPHATSRVIDASAVRGVSYARNTGARAATGELLVFCDADDVVHQGWLRAFAAAALEYDMIGGPLDVESLNSPAAQQARPTLQKDSLHSAFGHLPYAVGANFAVTKTAFLDLNGWGEQYRAGGDDIDFCWRGQAAGYRIGFAPEAVVSYRYRDGLRPLARQYFRYGMMEPLLFREHRASGMRRRTGREVTYSYWSLVRTVTHLAGSTTRRHIWLRSAAYQLGRVRGSIRFRTMFL